MSYRLFHISEQPGIKLFEPRPSPSAFEQITGDVVFAITEQLLHNYLLPRDCPRVTCYLSAKTKPEDKARFFENTVADYIIVVESRWYKQIANTTLYCYEFDPANFTLLDECAGYYVSYKPVEPISETTITALIPELLKRKLELRFMPSIIEFSKTVSKSTLNFSLIRMRNAQT
ncbi:DUF6886 family protein [Mucilaginibacter dorajii]|uniref:DarT domain-containing protein n=1 Tax=Mucilaginibacter dorajii TaxID=692994 RepID=A0ABP7QP31_9SPHI|nr:DUF6886 family protein [Mucilaginibacter dorajii]MCS3733831.1 hypothetical protein [Mucilaginibacter dorajii]